MTGKPAVSLCMIVKNEEEHLSQCLDTVAGKVDEIIIVDTGSTDRTVEIARSYGAEVHFFQWIDDFSAARNESLRHATCDWVFWMDADERLNCGERDDCLRETASAPGVDGYLVPIRSHRSDNSFGFHYAIRFFRRIPNIHFEGEVHESVSSFLQKAGAEITPASFLIEHWGYSIDSAEMDRKLQRNIDLLRKTLQQHPESAFARYYLGMSLLVRGQGKEAMEVLGSALEGEGLTGNLQALTLNAIAYYHLSHGEYDLAVTVAHKSLECIPNQNTARLFAGLAYYNRHDYKLALPYLFVAYQFFRLPPERRRTGISKEDSIDELDLLRAIAVCYAHQKQFPQAIAFIHRYLRERQADAEIVRILGVCCLNVQDFSSAVRYLKQAESLGDDPLSFGFPLAYAYLRTERLQESQKYFLIGLRNNLGTEESTLLEAIISYYFGRNRCKEASDFLERLARKLPDHPKVLDALGVTYIKTGDTYRAIEVHERLYAHDPKNYEVSRRLAALFLQIGDYDSTRKYMENR